MATGIIKLESIGEFFEKAYLPTRQHPPFVVSTSTANSSTGNSAMIGYSNPIYVRFESDYAFTNPSFRLDSNDMTRQNTSIRSICTGVVALSDEVWIGVEQHQKSATTPTRQRTLFERCRKFVQSKWRSISLSMLPVKSRKIDEITVSTTTHAEPKKNSIVTNDIHSITAIPSTSSPPNRSDLTPDHSELITIAEKLSFSCTPIYIVIILTISFVLVIGAITTVIDLRPEFIYGPQMNTTESIYTNSTESILL